MAPGNTSGKFQRTPSQSKRNVSLSVNNDFAFDVVKGTQRFSVDI